jgi:hypothetical protein
LPENFRVRDGLTFAEQSCRAGHHVELGDTYGLSCKCLPQEVSRDGFTGPSHGLNISISRACRRDKNPAGCVRHQSRVQSPQRAERTKADVGLVGGPNMRYLEAENEYCQRALADTKKLQENSNLVPK